MIENKNLPNASKRKSKLSYQICYSVFDNEKWHHSQSATNRKTFWVFWSALKCNKVFFFPPYLALSHVFTIKAHMRNSQEIQVSSSLQHELLFAHNSKVKPQDGQKMCSSFDRGLAKARLCLLFETLIAFLAWISFTLNDELNVSCSVELWNM